MAEPLASALLSGDHAPSTICPWWPSRSYLPILQPIDKYKSLIFKPRRAPNALERHVHGKLDHPMIILRE